MREITYEDLINYRNDLREKVFFIPPPPNPWVITGHCRPEPPPKKVDLDDIKVLKEHLDVVIQKFEGKPLRTVVGLMPDDKSEELFVMLDPPR